MATILNGVWFWNEAFAKVLSTKWPFQAVCNLLAVWIVQIGPFLVKLEQFQITQKVKDSPDFIHGAIRCMHSFALMMGDMMPGNQIRVIQIS